MRNIFVLLILSLALLSIQIKAQSIVIVPDSLTAQKLNVDSLKLNHLHADKAVINDLTVTNFSNSALQIDNLTVEENITTKSIAITDLSEPAPAVVFSNTKSELTNVATGFTITVPAADFFPEVISPVDNAASPLVGQIRLFSNGEVQGYGTSLFSLSAPLYLSLNNNNENITITNIEICGNDRNINMDLFAAIYMTGTGTPGSFSNVKVMETRSTGNAINYNCWPANKLNDDFDLNYKDKSYWIKVIPRHTSVAKIDDTYNGEFPEAWGTTTTGPGALKLVHVKVHYEFQASPAN